MLKRNSNRVLLVQMNPLKNFFCLLLITLLTCSCGSNIFEKFVDKEDSQDLETLLEDASTPECVYFIFSVSSID